VSLPLQLKAHAQLVDARLGELLPHSTELPHELHEAMRYSCLLPGKRLRPALCMASAEAVGVDPTSVLDAACAIEMVHCFSLIHDDLPAIDDDDLRRGAPTLHIKFSEALAILAGDALFALAFQTLAGSPHSADQVVRAIQCLTQASGSAGLVGGEVADVLSEKKPVNESDLEFIHNRKTGSLIAASCEIGGILSGADEAQIEALRGYGGQLGLAFQIADDILNAVGDEESLGKSAGSDAARGKATYPLIVGLERSRELASASVERAVAYASSFPEGGALKLLAEFAMNRDR
jgi:geranylgeranyl diphosphate synthase, type II